MPIRQTGPAGTKITIVILSRKFFPLPESSAAILTRRFISTGCSMGAYHAANFFFRHPDQFDGVIALSGLYQLGMFVGDYMDDNVYFNSPIAYLSNLNDQWYIDRYRQSQIIICCGQGAWEEPMLGRYIGSEKYPGREKYPSLDRYLGLGCQPRLALVAEDGALFFR